MNRGVSQAVMVLDGTQIHSLRTGERAPLELLAQAGLTLGPDDRLLLNGTPISPDQPVEPEYLKSESAPVILQIRRAVTLTLITPAGQRPILSTAFTVREALHEAGISLYASDRLDPLAETPITGPLSITYTAALELTVNTSGKEIRIRSSAPTVGEALAEAGLPLVGLDYSLPSEDGALPPDGKIQVLHVHESVMLALKSIPYTSEFVDSPDVELGQQEILQPGQNGLALTRTRVRYEDGQEVSRITESESQVRPPQTNIVNVGTKIVLKSVTVDGVTLEYWRALEMYATVYSPCNSGTGGCSSGTASGLPAGKGVVAVDPSLYAYLQGQRIYVPGYGFAVIGDIGGGYIVEQQIGVSRYRWIDLGFDDNNLVDMTGWLTVYFLAPAPASMPPVLQ